MVIVCESRTNFQNMRKRIFGFYFFAFITISCVAQDYKHYIIPTQEPNFALTKLYVSDNDVLTIPYDFVDVNFKQKGNVITWELDVKSEYYLDSINLGITPIVGLDNDFF